MSTKDKIIQTAIRLFNEKNLKAVTTNHIAKETGISPGNLYYHYKNKEEIVSEIFDRMVEDEAAACHGMAIDDIPSLTRYFKKLFEVYWKYRFFKQEVTFILDQDSNLKTKFAEYQKKQIEENEQCLRDFIQRGIIRPLDEDQIRAFANNQALLINFWIPYSGITSKRLSKKDLDQGIDIMGEKHAERQAPTVADLAARYIEEHLPKKRASSAKEDKRKIEKIILPKIGKMKVADVEFTDIDGIHRGIGSQTTANR